MIKKIVIARPKEIQWSTSEQYGRLQWKLLIDSTVRMTSELSVGILKIKPNDSLSLHHHSPKEIYIIKKGKGLLLTSDQNESLKTGDIIFIPENSLHGVQNIGKTSLLLYWIFPTDSWEEIKYNFVI